MNKQTEYFIEHLLNSPDACQDLDDLITSEETGDTHAPIRFMSRIAFEMAAFTFGIDLETAVEHFRLKRLPSSDDVPGTPAQIGLWSGH